MLAELLTTTTVSVSALLSPLPPWELIAGIAIMFFAMAGITAWTNRRFLERRFTTIGWGVLALVWVVMLPYYALEVRSPIQAVGIALAIPLSLWVAIVRWRGRESLVVIGNAVAITGAIYLPISTFETTRQWLIETVAIHTHELMTLLGHQPGLVSDHAVGYTSQFDFDGHTTYIVMACTGLGSIAVFAGAILAVEGEPVRKLIATAVIAVIIYTLNLVRNVFIGLATPLGWFDFEPFLSISALFGVEPIRNSYFITHTIISQPVSLLVVLGLALLALRMVPGLFSIFDEIIYVLTGDDVDLRTEFGPRILGEESVAAAD